MAKLENYTGSVELISGIKQKNNGDFPLMEAHAVQVDESGKRLDEALEDLESIDIDDDGNGNIKFDFTSGSGTGGSGTGGSGTGTGSEETDPTVPDWAKQPNKPTYTASEVGAELSGTAASKVNEHNASNTAHEDIRELIANLAELHNGGYVADLGYVTPQMFGAKGDGVTDDSNAFIGAKNNKNVFIPDGRYIIDNPITFDCDLWFAKGAILILSSKITINGSIHAGNDIIFNCDNENGIVECTFGDSEYNIGWFDGDSINEKWDVLRRGLMDNRPYKVVVPKAKKSLKGTVDCSVNKDGTYYAWKLTAPMYFNNKENLGTFTGLSVYATEEMDSALIFGNSSKTEGMSFSSIGVSGNNKVKNAILINACSHMNIPNISADGVENVLNCTGVSYSGDDGITDFNIGEIYASYISGTMLILKGTDIGNTRVTNFHVNTIFGERFTDANAKMVDIQNKSLSIYIDQVIYEAGNDTSKLNEAITIDSKTDAPYNIYFGLVRLESAEVGVHIIKGQFVHINEILTGTIDNYKAFVFEYAENCSVENVWSRNAGTLNENAIYCRINILGKNHSCVNNGKFNIINGVMLGGSMYGENMPIGTIAYREADNVLLIKTKSGLKTITNLS